MRKQSYISILLIIVLSIQIVFSNPMPDGGSTNGTTAVITGVVSTVFIVGIIILIVRKRNKDKMELKTEEVNITISNNNKVHVEGKYEILGVAKKNKVKSIFYPISTNDFLGEYTVTDFNLKNTDSTWMSRGDYKKYKGYRLFGSFNSNEQTCLEINYDQKIYNKKFEYLLTSALSWDGVIKEAKFRVKLPIEMDIQSSSYALNLIEVTKDNKIYETILTDFIPDKEFTIHWN